MVAAAADEVNPTHHQPVTNSEGGRSVRFVEPPPLSQLMPRLQLPRPADQWVVIRMPPEASYQEGGPDFDELEMPSVRSGRGRSTTRPSCFMPCVTERLGYLWCDFSDLSLPDRVRHRHAYYRRLLAHLVVIGLVWTMYLINKNWGAWRHLQHLTTTTVSSVRPFPDPIAHALAVIISVGVVIAWAVDTWITVRTAGLRPNNDYHLIN